MIGKPGLLVRSIHWSKDFSGLAFELTHPCCKDGYSNAAWCLKVSILPGEPLGEGTAAMLEDRGDNDHFDILTERNLGAKGTPWEVVGQRREGHRGIDGWFE